MCGNDSRTQQGDIKLDREHIAEDKLELLEPAGDSVPSAGSVGKMPMGLPRESLGEICSLNLAIDVLSPRGRDLLPTKAFEPGTALGRWLAAAVIDEERGETLLELQAWKGCEDFLDTGIRGHLRIESVDISGRAKRDKLCLRALPRRERPAAVMKRNSMPDAVRERLGATPFANQRFGPVRAVKFERARHRRELR